MVKKYSKLFSLARCDSRFTDYYLDEFADLWSAKNGKPVMILANRSELGGIKVNVKNLIASVKNTTMWQDFLAHDYSDYDNDCNKISVPKSGINGFVKKDVFVVSVIDDNGILKFSSMPVLHFTEESAKTEVERIAKNLPGKRVAYFRCCGVAIANAVNWA